MKPKTNSTVITSLNLGLAIATLSSLGIHTAQAQVTLTASDPANATSWNTGTRWSDSTAPGAGKTYSTNGLLLRSPITGGVTSAFGGDSLTVDGRFLIKSNGSTYNANYILAGGLIDLANGTNNTSTLTGSILLSTGSFGVLGANGPTEILTVAAPISGSGDLRINQSATFGGTSATNNGQIVLTAANTYTGATTLNGGTLELGSAGALGSTSALSFQGGILRYSAENTTDLSALIDASTHTQDLRIDTKGQNVTFATAMDNGAVGLDKRGAGTLTLGTANTYSGTTFIRGGELRATASGALGTGVIDISGGDNNDGRLGLSGGVTVSNDMILRQRQNAALNAVHIQNVSGNNELSGTLTAELGGNRIRIESAAGLLTLSGTITSNPANRNVYLQGAGDGLVSGVINNGGGDLSIFKEGAGTWTLSGNNTYTGATTVSEGTLVIDGNISTSSLTTVSGGTLQGSGVVGNLTATSGVIAPGNSIESLGAGNVSIGAGATYAFELNSAALNGDLLYSSGSLGIASGAILTLTELASGTLNIGDKLTLISYTGAWNNGLFEYLGSTLEDDSVFTLGSNQWRFNYNDEFGGTNFTGDQSGATAFVTMTVIPEPSVALLGGLGLLGLLRRRR